MRRGVIRNLLRKFFRSRSVARWVLAEAGGNVACPGDFWRGGCSLEGFWKTPAGKEGVT